MHHKVICRLKSGKVKKYEVDFVDSAQEARSFVISQIKDARTVLALVNKEPTPKIINELDPDDTPPLRYA